MKELTKAITAELAKMPEGTPVTTATFLQIADRETVLLLPPLDTGCLATGGVAEYEAYSSEMRNVSDSTQRRIGLSEKRNEGKRHHP